jgi:hypothetical protein
MMKLVAIEEHFLTPENSSGAGLSFLNQAAHSPKEKELFAHGNWERLTQQTRR